MDREGPEFAPTPCAAEVNEQQFEAKCPTRKAPRREQVRMMEGYKASMFVSLDCIPIVFVLY
jgi:hypothetical protein